MTADRFWGSFFGLLLAGSCLLTNEAAVAQTTNYWTDGSDKWEVGSNWSLGVPPGPNGQSVIAHLNGGLPTRFITIDHATALSSETNNCLVISNLVVQGSGGIQAKFSTVYLNNTGPTYPFLQILNSCTVKSLGTLWVTNSEVQVGTFGVINSGSLSDDGTVRWEGLNTLGNYVLEVYGNMAIGDYATGQMTISGGFVTLEPIVGQNGVVAVGAHVGSQGTLTIAGTAVATVGGLYLGADHLGNPGGTGNLIANGGILTIASNGGCFGVRTGIVVDAGNGLQLLQGTLIATNQPILVGCRSGGAVSISGGMMLASNVMVGTVSNTIGQIAISGGTNTVYSNMTLGTPDCSGTGTVTITGGELHVTNSFVTAVLDVEDGTFTQSGGLVDVDQLIVTNPCGRYIRTGGTLITGAVILNPNASAVGDGIANSWKQQYGLDPFDPNLATEDPDGDGMNNLAEFRAGTDPTKASSVFRVTSLTPEANNVRITWSTVTNVSYRVLVSSGDAQHGYTNNFGNLSPIITVPIGGPPESTTNYLDVGGATNVPSRYYRVRLVP